MRRQIHIETQEDIWDRMRQDARDNGRYLQAHLGMILTDYLKKAEAKKARGKK